MSADKFLMTLRNVAHALVLLLPLISFNGVHAQTATTIPFTYSGIDVTGEGAAVDGSGSFSLQPGTNANPSNFQFNFNASVPGLGAASFSYAQSDLTSLSLNLNLSAPTPSNVLSFNTVANNPTFQNLSSNCSNCYFLPESISVNAGNTATYNGYGQQTTAGTITLNQASLAMAIAQNAVTVKTSGLSLSLQPTAITAQFTPNFGLSLSAAAQLSGYTGYDWVQTMNWPTPNLYSTLAPTTGLSGVLHDPVPGGYTYQLSNPGYPNLSYPFYYDPSAPKTNRFSVAANITNSGSTLNFFDSPANPDLVLGEKAYFTTDLVGVEPDGTPGPALFQFTWTSSYDPILGNLGGIGGIAVSDTYPGEFDLDGGSGGITILSEQYFPVATPVPATWVLLITGFICMALMRKWRILLKHLGHECASA